MEVSNLLLKVQREQKHSQMKAPSCFFLDSSFEYKPMRLLVYTE